MKSATYWIFAKLSRFSYFATNKSEILESQLVQKYRSSFQVKLQDSETLVHRNFCEQQLVEQFPRRRHQNWL